MKLLLIRILKATGYLDHEQFVYLDDAEMIKLITSIYERPLKVMVND